MKMNDLLVFMTLEKYKKTHGNVAVRTDANIKKLDAIYRLNFFVSFLTFKFNFHNLKDI